MNIQSKINKLLMALKVKGIYLYIDTTQFTVNEGEPSERMITKYIVYETHPKEGEVFYSKIKILLYLADLYKKVGGADG